MVNAHEAAQTEVSPGSEESLLEPRKAALRDYFGPAGFERWKVIYGDGPVSFIRRTVREGHAAVVETALGWVDETTQAGSRTDTSSLKVLDAGCGPGLVSLALARRGHQVTGCDLSAQMVEAARQRLQAEPEAVRERASFVNADLEEVGQKTEGSFDLAVCLDVLIYYPEDELARILSGLKKLAPLRLIFTYAPASPPLRTMHWLGRKFPRRQRATRLEIIGEGAVRRALAANGWRLARQRHFNKGFYHVVLAEALP